MPTRRKHPPIKPKRASKLTIREIVSTKNGSAYAAFQVDWRDPDTGKRLRRQFPTREEAVQFRALEEIKATNAETAIRPVVTKLTSDQIAEAESAFTRLGNRGTLEEAVSFFLDRAAPPEEPTGLREAVVAFLIGKEEEGLREQSLRQLQSTLGRFQAFAEDKRLRFVHEADAVVVERFLRSLRAKGGAGKATPKTWNNYRADLSTFFSWCADPRRRWTPSNPCDRVARVKLDGTGEPHALSIWQTARLMRDAETFDGGSLARYFALAVFAGIRPGGELRKLATHPDLAKLIGLKRGIITIPPEVSKTRRKRKIVIRPALRAWLEETADRPILPKNFDRLVGEFRAKHGLNDAEGRDVTRHTFGSYHVAAFRSVGDAALEMGNSEQVIVAHYLRTATEEQGRAFWRICPKGRRIAKSAEAGNIIRLVA